MTTPRISPRVARAMRLDRRYGGLRQELRAYVATVLFGWAQRVQFAATLDLARGLAIMEREYRAKLREAAQLANDQRVYGVSFSENGQRVDPATMEPWGSRPKDGER